MAVSGLRLTLVQPSLLSQQIFNRLWPVEELGTTRVRLTLVGECTVNIAYKNQTAVVPKGKSPSFFGCPKHWQEINYVHGDDLFPSVFQEGLGRLQGFKARIHVYPNAKPRFSRPRSMPSVNDKNWSACKD